MASDGETSCANDPNFAAIYSFLKVFGKLYGLELPTIVKLQEFIENTEEVSNPLKELHLRLLRRALKSAHSDRWEKCMIKFCHQQGHHQEAWEIERFSYKKASTQVKLKVLKYLLEYQFTCHPKFKTAVNVIPSNELRLDPIGRDKNGCVYWLQIDAEANLCLYKEDQDEETWQLIARSREELIKVIGQLKSGEEIGPSHSCTENETSSGPENVPEPSKPEVEDENEEEFLSPESESEHEETDADQKKKTSELESKHQKASESDSDDNNEQVTKEISSKNKNDSLVTLKEEKGIKSNGPSSIENVTPSANENSPLHNEDNPKDSQEDIEDNDITDDESIEDTNSVNKVSSPNENVESSKNVNIENETHVNIEQNVEDQEDKNIKSEESENIDLKMNKTENINRESKAENADESQEDVNNDSGTKDLEEDKELSEAINEPVMLITGEGNGADCESFFLGEEISEEVMYFYGEGCGLDNDTGNPEAITETNEAESERDNDSKELVNGEHEASNTNTKISNVKLKSVAKRSLKKLTNDNNDAKPDTKKPCVRDMDKSNTSISDVNLKRETILNETCTDNESPRKEAKDSETIIKKNNVKKRRSKVKKKSLARKIKINDFKEAINSVSETDNCQDKTNIIEKRKSSVSSVDQDDLADVNNKDKGLQEDPLAIEPLPPKKLRLESTPESNVETAHSKQASDGSSDDAENERNSLNESISKRKKIKASKGKFKRKLKVPNKDSDKNGEKSNDRGKKGIKSLKRSLVEATMSDKNKSESQSESDDDEPISRGKRLKIKPKKIITSTRKKIEAKLLEKQSSDESEEETLYSLAGKKSAAKKVVKKKKPKSKDKSSKEKAKSKPVSDDSDTPVRQSRRIAQQKIKEEAERRHQEEVALRELKMIHKKKGKDDDDEEEWRASGRSSSEEEKKRSHKKTWRTCDSTGPEADSDSDSPLFDLQPEPEPDLDYGKSDHEFSPESDLETGEPVEPIKRARTLQEEKDDGFCKQCGSAEQPEWILLCDKCDSGYHASCLKPLLFYIPQGDWFCPPCNHDKLIASLESELVKFDELVLKVEEERAKKKLEEPEPEPEAKKEKEEEEESDGSSCSSYTSGSSGGVYRLRARRQLPVSLRAQEYDRLISAAIKEEYVEPTSSAGNQGRGKDISTIIEAAEEEKMKAEREAIEQGKPVESKKSKKKQRKKPRKLNSLEVPSEDDDETDEDFKDTGAASSSEDISSSAERDTGTDSRSSDSLPIRRTGRSENKKDRPKMTESSPEVKKKKKNVFEDSSSESAGAKEWSSSSKPKSKSHHHRPPKDRSKKRDKSKKSRRSRGLTQYDAEGNVIRARVTYGGLSGEEGENDWSPKHRTRQKKINYTEMPNTESEDEMHKSSGKHMPDSSDEFKITESDDSESDAGQKRREEERLRALSELVTKSAVVPLEKLPEEVTRAKTEELQAHLNAQSSNASARPVRGKGSRGGRGSRGPRGRGGGGGGGGGSGCGGGGRGGAGGGRPGPPTDEALAKLVGLKVKELGQDGSPMKPNQLEREKKRQEREAKQAEKEAKRQERLQKKEEKEKLKEQKAKEREEKKLAKIALQESKRIKKEKEYTGPMGYGPPPGGMGGEMFQRPPGPYHDQRFPNAPRLQVRAELRGMLAGEDRGSHPQHQHGGMREGTLSVAGSPQPFKPVSEEPSIITRMPHMINHQYRGPMMYPNNTGYGARGGQNMYLQGRQQYPPQYYRLPYGPDQPYPHHMQGPGGPPTSMHHGGQPGGPMHHPPGFGYRGPPPAGMPQGHLPDRPGASPNSLGHQNPHGGPPNHQGPPHQGPSNHQGPPSHLGGPPNQLGGPPNLAGPPGPRSGPPNSLGGPPGPPDALRGPPDALRGPEAMRGPPESMRGLPESMRGPPEPMRGPPDSMRGPPEPMRGPPESMRGPPDSIRGPQNPLTGPPDPLRGPPNMGAPSNLVRPNSHGPPDALRGPPNPHIPPNIQGLPPTTSGGPNQLVPNMQGGPPNSHGAVQMGRGSPVAGPSGMKHGAPPMSGAAGPSGAADDEPPIKIKAEVKTEPEYRSPPPSPGESVSGANAGTPREETLRHPKIKHTENKDRRPRFPLGPYAPHYAPFGPYAPHYSAESLQFMSERPRSPVSEPRPYHPHLRPFLRGPTLQIPPQSHHPVPNQNLPALREPQARPPSPHRSPRPAHPQLGAVPGLPPPTSHPLTQPPPTSHRPPKHLILPEQATPLLQPRPRTPTPSAPSPARSQSLTPPQNPPLHQPYVQQAQMLSAPMVPSRPTPPPALAQAPSPHAAHMMSQPPSLPRCTPPPGARTPPNVRRDRASPNMPIKYQYPDRRPPVLPQPIPRDSIPPQPPPQRREFDPPQIRAQFERPELRREFGRPELRREFERPEVRREFERAEPRQEFDRRVPNQEFDRRVPNQEFGRPDQRQELHHQEPRRQFEHPGPGPGPRREFEHPQPRREFDHPEPRREFDQPEPRREFEQAEPRREFEQPEPRRELDPGPRGDFQHPAAQRPEFTDPQPQFDQLPKEDETRQAEADSTIAIKTEPSLGRREPGSREESGVFGGLVSYFSSQHEDDIDA